MASTHTYQAEGVELADLQQAHHARARRHRGHAEAVAARHEHRLDPAAPVALVEHGHAVARARGLAVELGAGADADVAVGRDLVRGEAVVFACRAPVLDVAKSFGQRVDLVLERRACEWSSLIA